MPNPHLLFCPYLPLGQISGPIDKPIAFADWEIGPLRLFEDRWADPLLKSRAMTILNKYTGADNPSILCKKGEQLDGQGPCESELWALELALVFGFLESNPRKESDDEEVGGAIVTTDNAELHLWSINLQQGFVSLDHGYLAKTRTHGKVENPRLVIRPPLDLPTVTYPRIPDSLVLTGIYKTVLASLLSPNVKSEAHRVRVAVDWLAKAWRNTSTVHCPERLVFLKTAFEAVTGESGSRKSASKLRRIFESLPDAAECDPDFLADFLVWSPKEKPIYTWVNRHDKTYNQLTDLEVWFMAFSDVRNTIIHEGTIPPDLAYSGSPSDTNNIRKIYYGDFFSTATHLLCSAIKVLLSKRGYRNAWFPYRNLIESSHETVDRRAANSSDESIDS